MLVRQKKKETGGQSRCVGMCSGLIKPNKSKTKQKEDDQRQQMLTWENQNYIL